MGRIDVIDDPSNLDTFEYNLDYFSGAQAGVFIEHILVDEITSLQWTVQQSKIPIYGYASQTFDEMANGTIIVQGSFSINFTHSGYLWAILQELRRRGHGKNSQKILEEIISKDIRTIAKITGNEVPPVHNPKEALESFKKLLATRGGRENTKNITKHLNDIVWGPDNTESPRGRGHQDALRTDRRELNGFDIYLKFQHDGIKTPSAAAPPPEVN